MRSLKEIKEPESKSFVFELLDCKVVSILEDRVEFSGCETCDYGSEYGMSYKIRFSDGDSLNFSFVEMYEPQISTGDMMRFILNNVGEFKEMTKEQFKEAIQDEDIVLGECDEWE